MKELRVQLDDGERDVMMAIISYREEQQTGEPSPLVAKLSDFDCRMLGAISSLAEAIKVNMEGATEEKVLATLHEVTKFDQEEFPSDG